MPAFAAGLARSSWGCWMVWWSVLVACNARDYQVYQVAADAPVLSGDCTGDTSRSSDLRLGATVVVFAAPADVWYAETGGVALSGTRDDGGYTFAGETSDSTEVGNATLTVTEAHALDLRMNGRFVTGTYEDVISSSCDGGRQACDDDTSCTVRTTFSGVRVDDEVPARGVLVGEIAIGWDTGAY